MYLYPDCLDTHYPGCSHLLIPKSLYPDFPYYLKSQNPGMILVLIHFQGIQQIECLCFWHRSQVLVEYVHSNFLIVIK